MEYLDGQDLRKYARQNGGTVNPDFAKIILVTIASSLMEIHRMGILHRDLSPENIIVNPNQMITLIDFGAARNFVSCQNNGMSILLKPGFAPPEQYNTKGVQGPWTDVYALCATFYSIVSGKPLVDALFRYRGEKQLSLYSLGCPVTKKTSDVIERGMELDYKRRYKDFKAFLDDIDIQYTSQSKQQSINKTAPPANPPASPLANPLANAAAKSAQPSTPPRDMIKKGNSAASTASLIPTVSILTTTGISCKSIVRKNDILKIGRSKQSSNLVLDYDSNISRIHCSVRFDEPNNIFYISDMSVNGTYFEDGRRLEINKEYAVPPGSKFYLASKNNMIITGVEKK
jgi:serine/threonine protein kinase